MSLYKEQKNKMNYEELIIKHNKKIEQLYNTYKPFEPSNYNDNVIVYSNLNKHEGILYNDKKKAIEIEKSLYTNTKKNNIYIHKPIFHVIDKHIISCLTYIEYYITNPGDELSVLEKLTIEGVNMDKLIKELKNNKIDVDNLLKEIERVNFNLDNILEYMKINNIEITKMLLILNKNGMTMENAKKNKYIVNMLKQSAMYSWFCQDMDDSLDNKKNSKKIIKKISVYSIYKVSNEPTIISINWTINK